MNAKKIGYWVSTGLAALLIGGGGFADLSGSPQVVEGMTHLGYPAYFAIVLGTWKALGALAILLPKLPRLKEWAYAGILFDLTGASASHAFSGDDAGKVAFPLIFAGVLAASWALRPEDRKLAGPIV